MASSSSVRDALTPRRGVDPLARPDAIQKLTRLLPTFEKHNFDINSFTPAAITKIPMSVTQFCKVVRIFTSTAEEATRSEMISVGAAKHMWSETRFASPIQVVTWCNYLKSEAGQNDLQDRQFKAKLSKKATPGLRVEDAALISALSLQLNDLAVKKKEVRASYAEKLDRLHQKILRLKAKEEAVIRAAVGELLPAGAFVPLEGEPLTDACLKRYYAQCAVNDVTPSVMTNYKMEEVKHVFCKVAQEEHMVRFLAEGDSRKSLVEWIKSKILFCDQNYDKKQGMTFRRLLENIGD